MNRADRTTWPLRVTSATSTVPRAMETSTRRPSRVAVISKLRTPSPTSTRTSTRSPLMLDPERGLAGRVVVAARVPAAEDDGGDGTDREREPEGQQPVHQRRDQRVARGDPGERERRREAGLDEPEPARREGEEPEHRRRRERQERERGAGVLRQPVQGGDDHAELEEPAQDRQADRETPPRADLAEDRVSRPEQAIAERRVARARSLHPPAV